MREPYPISLRHLRLPRLLFLITLVIPLTFFFPSVEGHAPLEGANNETLSTSTPISDPTKSWAIYASLHEGGEAQYYKFDIEQGQRIHVMLLKSTRLEDSAFLPSFALMGPGLTPQGILPSYVEVAPGASIEVLHAKNPSAATYEAFSPSSFYLLAESSLDAPATGTYYIAVFEPTSGGNYALAVGDRESFTLSEWITTPFALLSIYQWEGQPLPMVLAPLLLTLAFGIAVMLFVRRNLLPKSLYGSAAAVSGLFFMGTGVTVLYQAVFSILRATPGLELAITMIWVAVPTLLGVLALRLAFKRPTSIGTRQRLDLAILGGLALFAWTGLIIGPVVAMIGALLPSRIVTATPFAILDSG